MIKPGNKVLVTLPNNEAVTKAMRRYHQEVMVVKEAGVFRNGQQDVTLYGAKSAMGADYHFLSDWLTVLEESEDKDG